ncbi:MAG: four helix bundle protein [Bacteroidales bacterium]|nr:four helix bundle protein [Bacteroidales bacterium]
MKPSILREKGTKFGLRIVRGHAWLQENRKEHIISRQLLRSGTSIGANITEAFFAESTRDFIHKLGIAQKECGETLYWLELLHNGGYFDFNLYSSLQKDAEELMKLLTASITTAKKNLQKP